MPLTRDIVDTYLRPKQVFLRLSDLGQREDRALAWLIGACALIFIGQWPQLARKAHLSGEELQPLIMGALMAWVFVAPLLLYALAGLCHLVMRAIGGQGHWYNSRLAIFWGLLASVPLWLLYGLAAGLAPGPGGTAVGVLWAISVLRFWITGLRVAYWSGPLASSARGA